VKRSRGRGRRPQHSNNNNHSGGSGGGGGNHNNNPNRNYDSSGPEVKIRGSAATVYEKYLQLARDANASGDRVMAENYLQHAEHYYRILAAQQAQQQQYQAQQQQYAQNNGNNNNNNNANNANNGNANGGQYRGPNGQGDQPFPQEGQPQGPSFSLNETENEGEEEPAE